MSEKEIEDHELEQLNKEIEAELNAYDADKEFQKEKKQ